jgi:hypothetical protein
MSQVSQAAPNVELTLFLAWNCPISNRYIPTLNKIAADLMPRGLAIQAYFGWNACSANRLEMWKRDYNPEFPVKRDDTYGRMRSRFRARTTPEAFVLFNGKVAYRGRIDDRYQGWGRFRPEATKSELGQVLEAALQGRHVDVDWPRAQGCAIDEW